MAAFRARRFVWAAISSITLTMSPICWPYSPSWSTVREARATALAIDSMEATACVTAFWPPRAASRDSSAERATSAEALATRAMRSPIWLASFLPGWRRRR
jgi:hypothetical protein